MNEILLEQGVSLVGAVLIDAAKSFWKKVSEKSSDLKMRANRAKVAMEHLDALFNDPKVRLELSSWFEQYLGTISTVERLSVTLDRISSDLRSELQQIGTGDEDSETISQVFRLETVEYIRRANHSIYEEYRLDDIRELLKTLIKEGECKVKTLESYEETLKGATANPSLTLDYFEPDNDVQIPPSAIDGCHPLRVIYRFHREAHGMTLFLLKKAKVSKPVLVAESKEAWDALADKKGCILLAAFDYKDRVEPIPSNTCIFFETESAQRPGLEVVYRRRSRELLVKKLEELGATSDRAVELINRTSGIYDALYDKLSLGSKKRYDYSGVNLGPKAIAAALLCSGVNVDSRYTGDHEFFETIYGQSLETFIAENAVLFDGDDPFVILKNGLDGKRLEVVNPDYAWAVHRKQVRHSEFKRLCDTVKSAIIQMPIGTNRHKLEYSKKFLRCALDTMALVVTQGGADKKWVREADDMVESIIEASFQDEKDYISEYIYSLAEVSPDAILRMVETQLDKFLLFLGRTSQYSGRKIVGVFSTMLSLKGDDYAIRSLRCLVTLVTHPGLDAFIAESLRDPLVEGLSAWYGIDGISPRDKIEAFKKLYLAKKWTRTIFDLITCMGTVITGVADHFRQRSYNHQVTWADYKEVLRGYYFILMDDGDENTLHEVIKSLVMISGKGYLSEPELFLPFEKLNDIALAGGDVNRARIANRFRRFVYDVKFYERDTLSKMPNLLEHVCKLVVELESGFNNPVFGLLRFIRDADYYRFDLNPVPYEGHGKREEERHKKELEDEAREKLSEAFQNGVSKAEIIEACGKLGIKQSSLMDFYEWFCKGEFASDVYSAFLSNGYPNLAVSYLLRFGRRDELVLLFNNANDDLKSTIANECLDNKTFFADSLTFSQQISSNAKKDYWRRASYFLNRDRKKEALQFALDNNDVVGAAYIICNKKDNVLDLRKSVEKLYEVFIQSGVSAIPDCKEIIAEYLELNQTGIIDFEDRETLFKAASLEMVVGPRSSLRSVYPISKHLFLNSPDAYADLQHSIWGGRPNLKQETFSLFYSVDFNLHFCPGYSNGVFDSGEFDQWVDGFKSAMEKNGLADMIDSTLLKLFAHATRDEDEDLPLPRRICEYIENSLKNDAIGSFCASVFNQRGVHTVDGGKSERLLADKYRNAAASLRKRAFPNVARLYEIIADDYENMAERERGVAEDGY